MRKYKINRLDFHYFESLLTIKSLYPLDLTKPLRQNSFLTPVYFPSSSTLVNKRVLRRWKFGQKICRESPRFCWCKRIFWECTNLHTVSRHLKFQSLSLLRP